MNRRVVEIVKYISFIKKTMRFILRTLFQHCIALPFTIIFCILKLQKDDCVNVIVCDHIGDMLFTLGYAEEYRIKNNIKKLRIYGTKRFASIKMYYKELNCEYIPISKKKVHTLLYAYNCKLGQSILKHFHYVLFIEPTNIFKMEFDRIKYFPDITLKECIKYGAFELSKRCELVPPYINQNESLCIHGKKQIIICPDAQIIDGEEIKLLTYEMGMYLKKQGYQIFINSQSESEYLNGFQYVNWGLDEFLLHANQSTAVIGTRSGILDLAAFANTIVIALYPSDYNEDLMRFFDIKSTNVNNQKLYQYRLTKNSNNDLQTIMKILDKEV